jgi:diacylglycerol kinase (ATP)
MRRLAYIINPISGTGGKNSLQHKIEKLTADAGFTFDIFLSTADGNYTEVQQFIRQNGVTDVVIAGGDGTINAVLSALRNEAVQFGILPCGSGNGLALSAGLTKNIDRALEIVFAGKSEWADAFLINQKFACMLCGLGFDAEVAHQFAEDPQRGLSTYVKKSVGHFFAAHAYPFELAFNDVKLELDAFFISIANSNQFGNNFTIAPQASLTDGLLDVVIVKDQSKLAVLLQTLRQVTGYNKLQELNLLDKNAGVLYFQTDAVQIENKGAAPLHIDGDPAPTATHIDIQVLHKCFRLILP